ncbi:hypothetical protein DVK44_20165 [Streptomyces paludis]|uniref:Uncharacterized protein n=2 Tax=Streptomyces paludis TaxID=2282738 RepID=A0A345HSA6_9ACTN|nr:hypothetical protein DVK44_20165 [Streptomyces paludis]
MVLAGAGGVAALATGWVFPPLRKRLVRPQLYGYGLLVVAAAFALQLAGGLLVDDQATELSFFTIPTAVGLVAGLGLTVFAQIAPRRR